MTTVYIGGRQTGKTTKLIKESARTNAVIVVGTSVMAQYIEVMAKEMGLDIPRPISYRTMLKEHMFNQSRRYLADDLQIILSHLNIEEATLDSKSIRYLPNYEKEAANVSMRFLPNGTINIKDLDKAKVLKALYDHSHIQGLGFLQTVPDNMVSVDHCRELLTHQTYFDYLYGKVLKVDLSGDILDSRLYDRDCGEGAAKRAIESIL